MHGNGYAMDLIHHKNKILELQKKKRRKLYVEFIDGNFLNYFLCDFSLFYS